MHILWRTTAVAVLCAASTVAAAQDAPVTGQAILTHPLGVLATRTVDLLAAGRFDEAMALRTRSDQDDWKAASAADKKDFAARLKARAPSPAAFADMVRKAGELTVEGNDATLSATTPAGTVRQAFSREGEQWRVSFGPMLLTTEDAAPVRQTRVEGPDLAAHPALAVVLEYVDLVHAGKGEAAIGTLGSADAQARWKSLPVSERRESLAFRRKMLPSRAAIGHAGTDRSVLLIEGDRASLNLIQATPATTTNSTGSSTTVTIPLALEQGRWRIAQ